MRKYPSKVFVSREELHPDLIQAVDKILDLRELRIKKAFVGSLLSGAAAGTAWGLLKKISVPAGVGGTALAAIGGGVIEYKPVSREVRELTAKFGETLRTLKTPYAYGEINFSEFQTRYPFYKIDFNGGVTFMSASLFQRMLKKAQENKVLREITPGRYRGEV
jgi:hypothetical protein